MDVDCSNLVDLLAVSLRNQHLGGSLFGDKMLRDVEWWAWCIKNLAGAGTLSRSGIARNELIPSIFWCVQKPYASGLITEVVDGVGLNMLAVASE